MEDGRDAAEGQDELTGAHLGIAEVAQVHATVRGVEVDEHEVTTTWGERATVRIHHDPQAEPRTDVLRVLGHLEGVRRPRHVGRTARSQLFVVLPPIDHTAEQDMAAGRTVGEFAAFNPVFFVVETLAALHANGVVHGELCPASIVWGSADGPSTQDGRVLGLPLLDGVPLVTAGIHPDLRTDDLVIPDWVYYASPQLLDLDPRTPWRPAEAPDDVYAIAAVIQSRVTGQPPVGERGMQVLPYLSLRRRPVPVCDELPPASADILRAAMSWDPRDRPTAAELAARMIELADPLER